MTGAASGCRRAVRAENFVTRVPTARTGLDRSAHRHAERTQARICRYEPLGSRSSRIASMRATPSASSAIASRFAAIASRFARISDHMTPDTARPSATSPPISHICVGRSKPCTAFCANSSRRKSSCSRVKPCLVRSVASANACPPAPCDPIRARCRLSASWPERNRVPYAAWARAQAREDAR